MKKKTKKTKKDDYCNLELDGHVYFVEYKNGKEVDRAELDGKSILYIVLEAIVSGVESMVETVDGKEQLKPDIKKSLQKYKK